jgi:hypothetical protein
VYRLAFICFLLAISLSATGCGRFSPLAPATINNYILPTNKQIDGYLRSSNLSNVISIDPIDNHFANILYKVGQNGIGSRVITSINGYKTVMISDGQTIHGDKMPEVVVGMTSGTVSFIYVYLNDDISKDAYKVKLEYYDSALSKFIEKEEIINHRNCFIYAGSKYNYDERGFQSITIYGENGKILHGKVLYEKD